MYSRLVCTCSNRDGIHHHKMHSREMGSLRFLTGRFLDLAACWMVIGWLWFGFSSSFLLLGTIFSLRGFVSAKYYLLVPWQSVVHGKSARR